MTVDVRRAGLLIAVAITLGGAAAPPAGGLVQPAEVTGEWTARPADGGLTVEIVRARDGWSWTSTFDLPMPQMADRGGAVGEVLRIERDAGVFVLDGKLDATGRGHGDFRFEPDLGYAQEMASLGYAAEGPEQLFQLAVTDLSRRFVLGLRELGYTSLDLDGLEELRLRGVTVPFVRRLDELFAERLEPEVLMELAVHAVTPGKVEAFQRLGYEDLSPAEVRRLVIHGVTSEYVQGLRDLGYGVLDPEELVRLRIHGVTVKLAREAAAGGGPLPVDELIRRRLNP